MVGGGRWTEKDSSLNQNLKKDPIVLDESQGVKGSDHQIPARVRRKGVGAGGLIEREKGDIGQELPRNPRDGDGTKSPKKKESERGGKRIKGRGGGSLGHILGCESDCNPENLLKNVEQPSKKWSGEGGRVEENSSYLSQ